MCSDERKCAVMLSGFAVMYKEKVDKSRKIALLLVSRTKRLIRIFEE